MAKKVLVVVDYQNDFVDGALGFPGAEKLDPGIAEKIHEYNENGDIVICTLDTHAEDYLQTEEGKNLPILHTIAGTYGWELYGETKKAAIEAKAIMLTKPTFPCEKLYMKLKELDNELRTSGNGGIDVVELCGVVSYMCVISNVVVSKMTVPNAHIRLLKNLSAGPDETIHNNAIEVMKAMQVEIVE